MANIGTFAKAEDGTLNGTIKTLQLNTKAKFVPLDATSNGGPDFRIFAGNVEIGAAWKKRVAAGPPLHLGQAGRSEPPGSDLRLPPRGRRGRPVQHDLDPPAGEVTDRAAPEQSGAASSFRAHGPADGRPSY